ncbi:uncharacterized protein LOC135477250 isoform X2 [Liolophura sinensis]|uniref:uncharacterized protein LOC135477250 isoform X2 n=1 Tax=Liolophura sinensis TaxID=3198878 RepID=UPI00315832DE
MDSGSDNLFARSSSTNGTNTQNTTTNAQKTNWFSGDSFGETDTDDLFASLASRHSITTTADQHAMEFDPFADSSTSSKGDKLDPFNTSPFTTTTTMAVNDSKGTDSFERNSSNDFDDLLNFDPLCAPTTADAKKSEADQKSSGTSGDSLFADLDPLFSTTTSVTLTHQTKTVPEVFKSKKVESERSETEDLFAVSPPKDNSLKATLCEAEDDPFEVSLPAAVSDQKTVQEDIFESMKADSSDPFSTDPFSSDPFITTTTTSASVTNPPSDAHSSVEKKSDGAAWLETVTVTLTKDESEADRSEVVGEGSEFTMEEESPVVMRRPKQKDETAWLETVTITVTKDESETDRSEVDRSEDDRSEGIGEGSEFKVDEESPVVMRRPKQKEDPVDGEEPNESLDLSAIQGTEHLDIDALKQKSSLRKKGSLALRRKPSRKSVRSSLLSVVDKYQDSTEPKESSPADRDGSKEVSSGVQEKHDEEKPENVNKLKPSQDRPSILPRGASRAPMGGQMIIPGLGDITKVKLRTSPVKPVSGGLSSGEGKAHSTGLTQPVAVPRVQLRSSSRSSLILPRPEKSATTTPNRASYNPFPSKPLIQTKPRLKTDDAAAPAAGRREVKPWQASWLREAKQPKLTAGGEEQGEKHLHDQEPEKPAWMKASIEKRQKEEEASEKESTSLRNKENNLLSTSPRLSYSSDQEMDLRSEQSSTDENNPESRLNELNYLHNQKSSPASTQPSPVSGQGELFIESSLTKTARSRLSVSDLSLNKSRELETLSKNGHTNDSFTSSTTSIQLQDPVIMRPKILSKQDYQPSWSRDSSNRVLPGSKDEANNQSSTDLPKWKRDLLEKRRSKPAGSTVIPAPKEAPSSDSNNPPWQKELQNKRRSSLKLRDPVTEPKQPAEPEWMRKAEERRSRLAKSGLIEKK